jgi:hypothetical protein
MRLIARTSTGSRLRRSRNVFCLVKNALRAFFTKQNTFLAWRSRADV